MIAVEAGIAAAFVVVAAAGVTGPAWLLVAGLTGDGFKGLWQHRSHFVANTRWWPPFCLVVDWVVAAIVVVLIAASIDSTTRTKTTDSHRPIVPPFRSVSASDEPTLVGAAITDDASPFALRSTHLIRGAMHQGALALLDPEEEQRTIADSKQPA